MFSSCSEWDNCYIPQNDKTKFFNENFNDCANGDGGVGGGLCGEIPPHQQQQQQYLTSNQFYETSSLSSSSSSSSPINNYGTISPTNEQSVNFNNNQFYQQQMQQNSNSFSNSQTTNMVVNYTNNCAFQNNNNNNNNIYNNNNSNQNQITRHHPYRRDDDLTTNQSLQLQQQQLPYQRSNFINKNYVPSPQQQQQQFQHSPQHVLYSPPPAHQQNYNFPSPPRIFNNHYNNHLSLQQQQQLHQAQTVPRAPSIPCQGNQPWTYAYCYGYGAYSNQEPCQFTQVVDIEDFMNNEKRKERSRDAARCRRSRETEIFTELAQVLPMRQEDVQQLDKASVMRIAIAYLKVRDMLKMFPKIQELTGELQITNNVEDSFASSNNSNDSDASNESTQTSQDYSDLSLSSTKSSSNNSNEDSLESDQLLKQTLDGFLLILSNDGDITYVTDNVCDYLGLSKIDILGQQIWEYAHQCDHAELKEALNIKRNGLADKIKDENLLEDSISTDHRDIFIRFKCTLTSRGRSINIKSASYKVIHITGHLVVNKNGDRVLVAMGRPIPHPSNIEVPLGSTTFLTKHSLDMKFTYVDDKMFDLMGYKPEDLLETSLFNCHHGIDSDSLMITFKNVLTKGQGETCRYRFLGKYGGYCWIVTQATIVYDKLKPQSVVCVNYVISNLEKKNEIYTLQQYEESQKLTLEENSVNNIISNNKQEILNENKSQEEDKVQILKDLKSPKEIIATADLTIDIEKSNALNNIVENTSNNLNNNSNKSINEEIVNQPTIIIKQEQTSLPIKNNNNNNPTTTTTASITPPLLPPTTSTPPPSTPPLPPPPSLPLQPAPSLIAPHCPTTTVTHTIFNKNISSNSSKFIDDKSRPKTVTSSLILTKLPTTTSTQSILQLQPLNVAPRAQSVTASVFSPLITPLQKLPSTTATAAILAQQQPQSSSATAVSAASAVSAVGVKATIPTQQDMNKGYLFAEDATELTMLKEEPDNLTAHLGAPNAVDACMPLDESVGFMGEMLVGFMGPYGGLLPDDINSLDSTTSLSEQNTNNNTSNNHTTATIKTCNINTLTSSSSSYSTSTNNNQRQSSSPLSSSSSSSSLTTAAAAAASPSLTTNTTSATISNTTATLNNTTNSTNIDPFINYRDESNDTNCSQHLLSPSVTSKSPEGSSLPSLCSPNSFSQEDEFSYYTMNVDDMDDLTMRAPYIPMNEQDDLPLLTSDDYMWSSGNAFAPDEFSLHTKDSDNLQAMQINHSINYQQQQFTQHQQQFSNSLCSSPASTVSSMSPSPIQQQQQQNSQHIFSTDSSELAALLCGSGNGTLSILQDTTNCANGGSASSLIGNGGGNNNSSSCNSGVLTEDLDNVDHHQLQQHCLQQLQEQLQQQQRQHQQLLSGLNINCKKEKFDTTNNTPSLTPNLCDSMEDTFENVYSKNSTNLDCWNEFLQINTNENNTSTTTQQHTMENLRQEDCKQQLHMQLQQQQQNIIINAVPLITIQANNNNNNKNLLIPTQQLQQQQQTQPQQQHHQQQQSNTKLLNKVNTIKLTPITSTATIKIIENNKQPLMQQQNIIKTAYLQTTSSAAAAATGATTITIAANNKRHLSGTLIAQSALDSKRLKSNIMDLQNTNTTTSQLLQQLITTPQQQQQQPSQQQQVNLNTKDSKGVLQSRWTSANENKKQQQQLQQQQLQHQQQSNSVLKNLLISGCDAPNLTKTEILTIDDASRSSMQSPDLCMSPSHTRPIQCMTSPAAAALRNYRHNPWIGGPGMLPSPTLTNNDDSNPPGLTPCDAIDSASDSGIDDLSITENMSPLKRTYEQKQIESGYGMKSVITNAMNMIPNVNNMDNNGQDNIKILQNTENDVMKISNNNGLENVNNGLDGRTLLPTTTSTAALLQDLKVVKIIDDEDEEEGASMCKRKRSISYLDSSNPLMTPFLMDLCNDDYNMNTKEYLQENDIENVLTEWPTDLV